VAARASADTVRVEGLVEFQKALRRADSDLPKRLRLANKAAAEVVAEEARRRVQSEAKNPTGKLAGSVAIRAEQRAASVKMGGARTPYAGFFDFGGRVGRNKSVERPFIKNGRVVYPAVAAKNEEVADRFGREIDALLRDAGLR
jgi:phage gpG-like protein